MASDEEIAKELGTLFRETNPNSFNSLNDVILLLQSKLGFDLSNKIDFIRNQISLIFTPPPPQQPQPQPPLVNPNHGFGFVGGHVQGGQQHVFNTQSCFPMGPTEICFGQPAGGSVVNDSVFSVPAKDSGQKPKRRGGSGGLNKICGVTPQLQVIVGQPAMPRTEIVRQLWAYIRKNNLQDPSNKRRIICNEQLRSVFEVDCTDMFQMNKLLAKHILPLKSTNDSGEQSKKLKVVESQVPISEPASPIVKPEAHANYFGTNKKEMVQSDEYKLIEDCKNMEGSEDSVLPYESGQQSKKLKAEVAEDSGGLSKKLKVEEPYIPISEPAPLIVISEALAKFFGTNEKEMAQSDVYKRIEEYIKTEGLEDPLNSMVICDTKLQELLGCESVTASAIRDSLARNHLFQHA